MTNKQCAAVFFFCSSLFCSWKNFGVFRGLSTEELKGLFPTAEFDEDQDDVPVVEFAHMFAKCVVGAICDYEDSGMGLENYLFANGVDIDGYKKIMGIDDLEKFFDGEK